ALWMISATPRVVVSCPIVVRPHSRKALATDGDLIQRIRCGVQVALRHVEIPSGVFQMRMAHQKLDRPQVGSLFHQGCGEAVAECMCANPLLDSGALRGFAADVPDGVIGDWLLDPTMPFRAGKQIILGPLPSPVVT